MSRSLFTRVAVSVVALLGVIVLTAPSSPGPVTSASTDLRFGVLGSRCAADRVPALAGAGVTLAEIRVSWARLEPSQGSVDRAYVQQLAASIARCRDAGIGVVLSPGFQYAPTWVGRLQNGRYRDQYGGLGPATTPNLVFSAAVRDAARTYLAELVAAVPMDAVAAVRIGTSESGELGYPGRTFGHESDNQYWAFDAGAAGGSGLATGIAANPLPGWVPGQATWQSAPVTADQARAWFAWYSGTAVDAVGWTVDVLRGVGYAGEIHLPLAGRGALPPDLDSAVGARLDGTGDRDGSLERGLDYPTQLPRLRDQLARLGIAQGSVVIDTTGVDDATAVAARKRTPPADACLTTDPDGVDQAVAGTGIDVASWPGFRWTAANARRAGFAVMGENPGSPDAPGTGGDPLSDGLQAQMRYAPGYARACGFTAFMWAFEDDLFGDTPPHLTADDYGSQIRSRGDR